MMETKNRIPIKEEDGKQKEWYKRADKMTLAELPEFLRELTEDYGHDYGTICHAVAAAAIAAAWAVERTPCGGITGFQAGAVMWEIIEAWGSFGKGPKRVVCYANMAYPQYEHDFQKTISDDTWKYLQGAAVTNLAKDNTHTHRNVVSHWQSIADGKVPFGYEVRTPDPIETPDA